MGAVVGSHDLLRRGAGVGLLELVGPSVDVCLKRGAHALARAEGEQVRVILLELGQEDLLQAVSYGVVAAVLPRLVEGRLHAYGREGKHRGASCDCPTARKAVHADSRDCDCVGREQARGASDRFKPQTAIQEIG